tara:strand:+ start:6826 stop:6969 length:144 start_codon:yes stop_codon:yes gene_type:complete
MSKVYQVDKEFTVQVRFTAKSQEDAEDFVNSMSTKDWLEHLDREKVE